MKKINIKHVLDASALIAVLMEESGSDAIVDVLSEAYISSVNLSEVISVLVSRLHRPPAEASRLACNLVGGVVPLTKEQSIVCGGLISQTKPYGLSLGDRACIALGMETGATVYTTDKVWLDLRLEGLDIVLVR